MWFFLYFQILLLLQAYRYYQVDAHSCALGHYVNVFTLLTKMCFLIPVCSSSFTSKRKIIPFICPVRDKLS